MILSRVKSGGEGKTFLYRFDGLTSLNMYKKVNQCDHMPGTSHGDDYFYIFKTDHAKFVEL